MVKIEEEPHWHLPTDNLLSGYDIELIGNYQQENGEPAVPLSIIQGEDSIWFNKEQVEALRSFIDEKVLI